MQEPKEYFIALKKAAENAKLIINKGKTNYMFCEKRDNPADSLEINQYRFINVKKLTYLGSEIEYQNEISPEIQKKIFAANHCLFDLRNQLKSHLIKRRSKFLLYKTLVRPILAYASETWSLTAREEKMLIIFERKVLLFIFGCSSDTGNWHRRCSFELYLLF